MEQTESKASSMSSVSEIISFIERNPIIRKVPFSIPGNPTKATSSSSHWNEIAEAFHRINNVYH
jgi:hypothetical protein